MNITKFEENEDGSANCYVDLSCEESKYLINFAIVELLGKGVVAGKELSIEDDEELELDVVVKTLKSTLVTTYLYKWEHDEDVIHNLRVRRGCKALLRHYMIPALAEKYIAQIECIHEGGEDE
jgi:hypothetical protein